MEISPTQTSAFAPSGGASSPIPNGLAFSEALATARSAVSPASGKADIVAGQLGVQLEKGRPYAVVYFDATGQKLTQTPFSAPALLEKAAQFGIPLGDLNGLADQMDAKGVAYKPYQLFQGTGSDGGIDLRDLAAGGLGTAYDWRVDPNVSQKAKSGADTLLANQILAQQLGVTPSNVTRQATAAASVDRSATAASAVAGSSAPVAVTNPQADITSGRLGVLLDKGVRPYAVVYFDNAGQKLTQTTFEPASILRKATEFGIPLSDLNGLADQMDAKGVAYKPYQLFQGTGSDGGIDLRDLATGGLGTAYDWRVDPNVSQKAKSGADTLLANQILAQQLGVTPSSVTRQATAAASVDRASTNASAVVAASSAPTANVTNPQADITSGRLGVLLDKGVRPYAVVYFDDAGQKLTQTTFEPASILRKATEFGIPFSDLNGLADQMDAKGVAYKPYQLFQGTGSDGGIDLRDLATGGLGTAYDWRADANVSQKSKSGADTLLANQILAQQLGLTPSSVTA